MRKSNFCLFSSLCIWALTGCSPSQGLVQSQIHQSIEAEQNAPNLISWQNSEHHPDQLFAHWKKNPSTNPCKPLLEIKSRQLLIFADQIQNTDNQSLLADCKNQLVQKISEIQLSDRQEWIRAGHLTRETLTQDLADQTPIKTTIIERDFSKPVVLIKGDLQPKQVILTFDDGPHPTHTKSVLTVLQMFHTKAIFFQLGKNVIRYPLITQSVARRGHGLGNHSWKHSYMGDAEKCATDECRSNWVSPKDGLNQFIRTHNKIRQIVGWVDPFIRFPFGSSTPELNAEIKKTPTAMFYWNADSNDWRASHSDLQVVANSMESVRKANGGIVLFHDVYERTADILPEFLRQLAQEGFEIVLFRPSDRTQRVNHPWLSSQTETHP